MHLKQKEAVSGVRRTQITQIINIYISIIYVILNQLDLCNLR